MNLHFKGTCHHCWRAFLWFFFFFFFSYIISFALFLLSNLPLQSWLAVQSHSRTLLKSTDWDFVHFTTPRKMRWPSDFFLSWLDVSCLLSLLSPWWDTHVSMAFHAAVKSARISLWHLCSIATWRKWQLLEVGTVSLWFDFRLEALVTAGALMGLMYVLMCHLNTSYQNSFLNIFLLMPVLH